jgi:DNA-binding CsgD family transcriptional regulator
VDRAIEQGFDPEPVGQRRVHSRKAHEMPSIDIEVLSPFAAKYMQGTTLTPAERAEVLRMAQGFACKDSAAAANVSPETIRARRKRIYRKLDLAGAGELISELLALSLQMLAKGEKIEVVPASPAQPQAQPSQAAQVAAYR